MEGPVPQIDESRLDDFGNRLFDKFTQYKNDRKAAEDRWLQNLRQFRGIYDPDVVIPKGSSRAYPKLTRWKVIGTVARLMQMLFPQTERNFDIVPSPMPDLDVQQLQHVLDTVVQARADADGVDPTQVELTDDEIEEAVLAHAKGRAEKMMLKIDDDLQEIDYPMLARKVVFSAALYNVGVLEGPLLMKKKARVWERDGFTGRYHAKEVDKLKPVFDFCPVWEHYPDMAAVSLGRQEGTFRRRVMLRSQVEELASRDDFLGHRVKQWLNDHLSGNHQAEHWETTLQSEKKSDRQYAQKSNSKYVVLSYWGSVIGADLAAAGIKVKEEDLGRTFQANVWVIDNTVIKAKLAPFQNTRMYHEFVFEEDDLSLLGNGQVDTLRDSQLGLAEVTRAALDNMSVVGPQVEVNQDMLVPGHALDLRKNKVWVREGEGAMAQIPAVRNVAIDSHIGELTALMDRFIDFANNESGLPPPSLGDVSGGGSEALRTQQNASMFLGAAALPIRDTVRNFDTFTKSVIGALVRWNMKYDPNPSRDGDLDVIPRGSTSLIAKEVQGQQLDLFRATITEDERPHLRVRKLLEYRMKAHDLPADLLEDEKVAQETIDRTAQVAQSQAALQEEQVRAQVQELLTRAFKNAAQARGEDASITIEMFNAIIEALNGSEQTGTAGTGKSTASA